MTPEHPALRQAASAAFVCLLCGACALPFGEEEAPAAATVVSEPAAIAPAAPPPPDEPAPPAEPTLSIPEQQARKISSFVEECTNRFGRRVADSRARYLRWVDPETGPTGRERYISYGVYTISDPADCREAVDALSTQPPSMPDFERDAERYASALEQLYPLLQQADTYYERESYRDDDAARGRELHPQLMAGWESFRTARGSVVPQLQSVERQARAARLGRLADDPAQRTRFLVERTMGEARGIVDAVHAMRVEDRRLVSDDSAAFVSLVQTFQAHVDELRGHRPTPPDRAPESGLDSVRSEANEVVTSALGVMRRVRDGERFDRSEMRRLGTSSGWMTDGSPDELFQKYDRLVDAYNRMR